MSDIFKAKINNQWVGIPSLIGPQGPQGPQGEQGPPGVQVNTDWNETDTSSKAYILHKPTNVSTWTNDAGYITQSNVPIESISVNGTTQTITNKNVDISVPTQGQIASGNTGYVTGGDVYNWEPPYFIKTILIDAIASEYPAGSINYNVPSMNVGETLILIFNNKRDESTTSSEIRYVKRPILYFQHDSSRYKNTYVFNEYTTWQTTESGVVTGNGLDNFTASYSFYSSTSNPSWTAEVRSTTSQVSLYSYFFRIEVMRVS